MTRAAARLVVALVAGLVATSACGREEEAPRGGRTPIVETRLRTPMGATRVRQALSAHTPKAGETDEPIVRDGAERAASPKVAAPKAAAPTEEPDAAKASATEAPAVAKPAASVPEPTPIRLASRSAIVLRGVELADGPRGTVLGDFHGRTEVTVLEDRDGWSRVRTQVVDGGSIEGWVESARLADPSAKPAVKPAPASAKTDATKKATTAAKSDAPANAAPAKTAPAKAAKKPAGNGPDDILLVPIAGTEKKRPATPFTHKAHWDDYSIKCEACHHPVKAKGGDVPSYTCSSSGCHTASECDGSAVAKKNKACPNFEDAFHIQCIDCHKKDGGPTKCAECHSG